MFGYLVNSVRWKKKKLIIFVNTEANQHFHSLYEVKEECHWIVGSLYIAWVVRLWKNFNLFHYQLSKCTIVVQIWSEKVKKVFWNMSQIGLCRTVLCEKKKIDQWLPKCTVPFVLIMEKNEKVLDFGYTFPLFQRGI